LPGLIQVALAYTKSLCSRIPLSAFSVVQLSAPEKERKNPPAFLQDFWHPSTPTLCSAVKPLQHLETGECQPYLAPLQVTIDQESLNRKNYIFIQRHRERKKNLSKQNTMFMVHMVVSSSQMICQPFLPV
jgi:hypothetical protein